MHVKSGDVMRYVGSAMAVGGAVMLGSSVAASGGSLKKKAKKTAVKAIDAMDSVLTNVQHLMK